ncbi:MAG: hypothetical protein A2277_03650 [Desulfobacterales bacterium RIFOXYA12_FULL_46_15]|nr:MAG: hypothetical protein A2097_13055 [Desulfobacula sp. GWF2_41_7]OGR24661.1 MAG: hypothetical protein A2277_03650 [Desulfobacterales bacterium RIFOXYA12_FULL_46_15]
MANINPINETIPVFGTSNAKAAKTEEIDSFGIALSKALDKTQEPETGGTSAKALTEIGSKELNIITTSDIVSGKTNKLLALLDSYSSKLVDPAVSLKSIAPVLEEINANAGNLMKETQFLTDADSALKKIATQTAVTAQTEYLKFQRGDYL